MKPVNLVTKLRQAATRRYISRAVKISQTGELVQLWFFTRDGTHAETLQFFIDPNEPIDLRSCLSTAGFEPL